MILRLALASFLVHDSFVPLTKAADNNQAISSIAAAGAGILLLFGVWTPVAAVVAALLELRIALSLTSEPWASVLAAAVALSLALLGSWGLVY